MVSLEAISVTALAEHATSDTSLEAFERESQLRWSVGDEHAHVETAEPALIRRWVHLEHFALGWFTWVDREGRRHDYGPHGIAERWFQAWHEAGRPDVVSIAGSVPIGAVTLKTVPRDGDEHARITPGAVLYD